MSSKRYKQKSIQLKIKKQVSKRKIRKILNSKYLKNHKKRQKYLPRRLLHHKKSNLLLRKRKKELQKNLLNLREFLKS
jgi:hypothetical protein